MTPKPPAFRRRRLTRLRWGPVFDADPGLLGAAGDVRPGALRAAGVVLDQGDGRGILEIHGGWPAQSDAAGGFEAAGSPCGATASASMQTKVPYRRAASSSGLSTAGTSVAWFNA